MPLTPSPRQSINTNLNSSPFTPDGQHMKETRPSSKSAYGSNLLLLALHLSLIAAHHQSPTSLSHKHPARPLNSASPTSL